MARRPTQRAIMTSITRIMRGISMLRPIITMMLRNMTTIMITTRMAAMTMPAITMARAAT